MNYLVQSIYEDTINSCKKHLAFQKERGLDTSKTEDTMRQAVEMYSDYLKETNEN